MQLENSLFNTYVSIDSCCFSLPVGGSESEVTL